MEGLILLNGGEARRTAFILGILLASAPVSASSSPSPTVLLSGAAPAGAQPAQVADAILTALVESGGVPGMGASIWRNGAIIWTGSAGLRDVEAGLPVTADTWFRFASVSKLFTAIAAAQLREQGKLDVDAPIASLLPYLPQQWPAITSAQLAAHTAGVPHYQPIDEGRGKQHFDTVQQAAAEVVGRPLLSAPGTNFSYSSWGYVLLSSVVEARAGMPYLDMLARDITRDLAIGPDATGSANGLASKAYIFTGHKPREAPQHDFSYTWGGGGLGGTAPALAKFGGRVLDGHLLSPATLEWMQTPATLSDGTMVTEQDHTVGFGWRRSIDPSGRRILHHAGAAIGARSALLMYPEQAMVVALLSNARWTAAIEQSAQTLAAAFLSPALATAAMPCPVQTTSHQVWEFTESAAAERGPAHFAVVRGVCTGRIPVPVALAVRLARFPQRIAQHLTIIGVDPAGGLSQAALVTPMGAYPLVPIAGGRYQASLGGNNRLTLRFD